MRGLWGGDGLLFDRLSGYRGGEVGLEVVTRLWDGEAIRDALVVALKVAADSWRGEAVSSS